MTASSYREQVVLLLRILPIVARETTFALKGGTAINLFVRNFPRLSVDIDLAYLPLTERVAALSGIHEGLGRIASGIERQLPDATVHKSRRPDVPKLFVDLRSARVKVEPNTILRGSAFPPGERRTVAAVESEFEQAVSVPVLSVPDLYGGKLVAALDRQHPRDLFDVKLMLEAEGITDDIRTAFVAYLASHGRPIAELLAPKPKPIERLFEAEFRGMTRTEVTVGELEEARTELIRQIQQTLTEGERKFLLSLKRLQPEWDLIPIPHLREMPAIRWKLRNLDLLAKRPRIHQAAVRRLQDLLEI